MEFCEEEPNISIKDYFIKWRLYNLYNRKESIERLLATPCVLPGCNYRYNHDDEKAKQKHMLEIHKISPLSVVNCCKIIQKTNYHDNCVICGDKSLSNGEIITHLPCGHPYHKKRCIDPWLKKNPTCPLCRDPTDYKHEPFEVWKYRSTHIKKIPNSNLEFKYIRDYQCKGITSKGLRCRREGPWCHHHYSPPSLLHWVNPKDKKVRPKLKVR